MKFILHLLLSALAVSLTMLECDQPVGPGSSAEVSRVTGSFTVAEDTTSMAKRHQTAASNARVMIRSHSFFPDVAGIHFSNNDPDTLYRDTLTDSSGVFIFDRIPNGMYVIEGISGDGNRFAYIDSIIVNNTRLSIADTVTLDNDTLKLPSTVTGTVAPVDESIETHIAVLGLDRFVTVDKDGSFTIGNLPEGTIRLQFITSLDLHKPDSTSNIRVELLSGSPLILKDSLYGIFYGNTGSTVVTPPSDGRRYSNGEPATILSPVELRTAGTTAFIGWNTEPDGGGTLYTPGETLIINGSNIQLYAQSTIEATARVIYDGNENTGGTVPFSRQDHIVGTVVTVAGNSGYLVNKGYSFIGWNTESDGSGISYRPGDTFEIGSSDITLYARWTTRPTFTVTYSGNGNSDGHVPIDENRYMEGATVRVSDNAGGLSKGDLLFTGWNTSENGSGTDYTPGETFTIRTSNVSLFAQWEDTVVFFIRYHGNGSTGDDVPIDSNRYKRGDSATILGGDSLQRGGYSFIGWNVASDGDSTAYSMDDQFTVDTSDLVLYAQWELSPVYTVIYDGNGNTGGDVPTDTSHYRPGDTVTVLAGTAITREQSVFFGWQNNTGVKYPPGATFIIGEEHIELFATWMNIPDCDGTTTSLQTRARIDGVDFTHILTATPEDTIHVATFINGEGVSLSRNAIMVLSGPGYLEIPANDTYFTLPKPGTYILSGYCGSLTNSATITIEEGE